MKHIVKLALSFYRFLLSGLLLQWSTKKLRLSAASFKSTSITSPSLSQTQPDHIERTPFPGQKVPRRHFSFRHAYNNLTDKSTFCRKGQAFSEAATSAPRVWFRSRGRQFFYRNRSYESGGTSSESPHLRICIWQYRPRKDQADT